MSNIKSNYWFKRKTFGFGWTPVTWQGWLTVIIYIAFLIFVSSNLENTSKEISPSNYFAFVALIILSTLLLLIISYKKGPSPKWSWGKKEQENSDKNI